ELRHMLPFAFGSPRIPQYHSTETGIHPPARMDDATEPYNGYQAAVRSTSRQYTLCPSSARTETPTIGAIPGPSFDCPFLALTLHPGRFCAVLYAVCARASLIIRSIRFSLPCGAGERVHSGRQCPKSPARVEVRQAQSLMQQERGVL